MISTLLRDKTKVHLKWNKNTKSSFSHYIIKAQQITGSDDSSSWESATTIVDNYNTNEEYFWTVPSSGLYAFFIKSVGKDGFQSRNARKVIKNFSLEPSPLVAGTIVPYNYDTSLLKVSWDSSTDTDIDHYEVCFGEWNDSIAISTTSCSVDYRITSNSPQVVLVKAVNAGGYSSTSLTLTSSYKLEPSSPVKLTTSMYAKSYNKAILNISWGSPSNTDINHYEVCYRTWSEQSKIIVYSNNLDFTITDDEEHIFLVKAVNKAGYSSLPLTLSGIFKIHPLAPLAKSVSISPKSYNKTVLKVEWNPSSDTDIDHYIVCYHKTGIVDTYINTSELFIDFEIDYSGVQNFSIKAVNIGGFSSEPLILTGEFNVEPSSPTAKEVGIIPKSYDKTILRIEWNASIDKDISYYEVCYGSWDSTKAIRSTDCFIDYTIKTSGVHNFLVRAFNVAGFYSSVLNISGVFNVEPEAPTAKEVSISPKSYDRTMLHVEWNASTDTNIDHYEVCYGLWNTPQIIKTFECFIDYRIHLSGNQIFLVKAVSTTGYKSVVLELSGEFSAQPLPPVAKENGGLSARSYNKTNLLVEWSPSTDTDIQYYLVCYGEWSEPHHIMTTECFIEYDISIGGTQKFLIKAVNLYESSEPLILTGTFEVNPNPPVAKEITYKSYDRTTLMVDWNAPADKDIAYYEICYGTEWNVDAIILSSDCSIDYKIAESGVKSFLIRSINVGGFASTSLVMSGTFTIEPSPPTAKEISISPKTYDKTVLHLEWNASPDKDIYHYEVCFGEWDSTKAIVTTTCSLDYNITASGLKTFIVKAVNVSKNYSTPLTLSGTFAIEPSSPKMKSGGVGITAKTYNKSILKLEWDAPADTDIDHYLVCYGEWNSLTAISTNECFIDYTIARNGTHTFLVKAVNYAKFSSVTPLTLTGSFSVTPSQVSGISVYQSSASKSHFEVTWTPSADTDILSYSVKQGAESDTWESATDLYKDLTSFPFTVQIDEIQISKVMIKAKNVAGYYSTLSKDFIIDTTSTGSFSLKPSAPTNGKSLWNSSDLKTLKLSWDVIDEFDFMEFQIRPLGTPWSDPNIIHTPYAYHNIELANSGIFTYFVRTVNKLGYFSEDVALVSPNCVLEPPSIDLSSFYFSQSSIDHRNVTVGWTYPLSSLYSVVEVYKEDVTVGTGKVLVSNSFNGGNLELVCESENVLKIYVTVVNSLGKRSAETVYSFTPVLVPSAVSKSSFTFDSTNKSRAIIKWEGIGDLDLDSYEIKEESDSWEYCYRTKTTTVTYSSEVTGDKIYHLRSKNLAGFYSPVLNISIPFVVEPSSVFNFKVVQSSTDRRTLLFDWSPVADLDADHYVIKQGSSWDTAVTISSYLNNGTNYSFNVLESGNYTFLIKAVNKNLKESVLATVFSIAVNLIPNKPTSALFPFQTSPRDKSLIMLAWNPIVDQDLLTYQIKCNGSIIAETKDTTYQYNIYTIGAYQYSVCAKNYAGKVSSDLLLYSGNLELTPSDINSSGFSITQSDLDSRSVNFEWLKVSDSDLSFYEIRMGSSWDSAVILATNIRSNYYQLNITPATYATYDGSNTYLIKAVNNIGFYSNNAVSLVKTLTFISASVSSGSVVSNPSNRFLLTVSWTKITSLDLDYYEVTYLTPSGISSVVYRGKESSFIIDVSSYEGSLHTFSIKTKNLAGFFMSSPFILYGNIVPFPSNVSNFTAIQSPLDRRIMNFTWSPSIDTDFSYYEIRKGGTWETGQVVSTNITGSSASYMVSSSETGANYMIKAFNTGGKESQTPANSSLDVALKPSKPTNGSASHDISDKSVIVIKWNPVTDTDIMNYELKLANQDLMPETDLASFYGHPSNTPAVKQSDGFYKLDRGSDSELLIPVTYPVTSGEMYTAGVHFKSDGSLISFSFTFLTVNGRHLTPANIIDVGGGIKFAYASYTVESGATYLRAIDLYDLAGDWTWISIHNTRLERVISIKESFYKYSPDDLNTLGYDFIVQSKNIGGQYSDPLWIPFTANFCPSNVENITATQSIKDHTKITVAWDGIADKDIAYYIIKRGTDWNNPQKTYTVITQTFVEDIITSEAGYQWMVKAVNKTGLESSDVSISATYNFDMNPPTPVNITCTQDVTNRENIVIQWQEQESSNAHQEDLKEFEVRYGATWDSSTLIIRTNETSINWKPSTTLLGVKIFIKATNNANYQSGEAYSIPYNIILEPNDVTNFKAIQNGESILFNWDKSFEADVSGYEIREGSSFINGNVIASGITLNQFSLPVDMEVTRMFHIKAINRGGRYSSNSNNLTITIRNLLPKNVIQSFNEIPEGYITFDGSNYVNTISVPSSDVYTVEFWTQFSSDCNATMPCGFGEMGTGVDLFVSSGVLGFNEWTQAPYGTNISSYIGDGKWHFVVAQFTLSFSSNKIWIDGNPKALLGANTKTFTTIPNTFSIGRGASDATSSYLYKGKMKKVRMYNKTLLDSEVLSHYRGIYEDIDTSLLSYWKFDDLEGTIVDDLQGLNTGTVVGTPLWGIDIPGTLVNAEFGKSTINCSNVGIALGKYRCSDFTDGVGSPTTKCNQIGGNIVLKLSNTGGVFSTSGSYTTVVKDMLSKVTANIGTIFSATSAIAIGINAVLEYRTSIDNVIWEEWRNFIPVLATFRYIQFKVEMSTTDTTKSPEIPLFAEIIDVPDMDKHGTALVPAEGLSVYYDPYYLGVVYFTTPTVVATSVELGKIAVVEQSNIFLDKFVVKVYNISDMVNPVSGMINWIAKGY